MAEGLGDNGFIYTDIQIREPFIQDWYVMNIVYHNKTESFYALLVPDLVRSYTLTLDLDRNEYNRLRITDRVHAYVDRIEEKRIFSGNLVW